MAHPKISTVVNRTLLTASAAALMVGPLAGAGFAQALTDPLTDLTCDEAKETEDILLIEEFCTDAEAEASESPLAKSVDEVTGTVDRAVKDTTETAPADDGGDDGGGTADPGTVLAEPKAPKKGSDVGTTGDGGFTGVDEGSAAGSDGDRRKADRNRTPAGASSEHAYNADGPLLPGMRSNSSLTLQPFAAPLVSVPPIYELPQIASQLFGGSASTAGDPTVAGSTTATGMSPTGYSATSADPTGWLAATATGLIMLVGAGHAINGGRTPKGNRA